MRYLVLFLFLSISMQGQTFFYKDVCYDTLKQHYWRVLDSVGGYPAIKNHYEYVNNAKEGICRLYNTTLSSGRNAYQDAEVVWMADNSDSTVTYSNKGADFTLTRADSTISINNEGEIYIWYRDYANIDFSDNQQKAGLLLRDEERIELGNWFVYPVINAPSQEIDLRFTGATEGTIYWGDGSVTAGYTSGTSVTHSYSPNFTGLIKIEFDVDVDVTEMAFSPSYSNENIGQLPSILTLYRNEGLNQTSGDLASLPSGLDYYQNMGLNTTSGDLASLPSVLTLYYNRGLNTTSGDLASLPSVLTFYRNEGLNTVSDYTGKVWPSNMRYFLSRPTSGNGLSTAEVDQLLIDFAATTWTSSKFIDIAGNNAARSSASDAAVTSLTTAGVTVITN